MKIITLAPNSGELHKDKWCYRLSTSTWQERPAKIQFVGDDYVLAKGLLDNDESFLRDGEWFELEEAELDELGLLEE